VNDFHLNNRKPFKESLGCLMKKSESSRSSTPEDMDGCSLFNQTENFKELSQVMDEKQDSDKRQLESPRYNIIHT